MAPVPRPQPMPYSSGRVRRSDQKVETETILGEAASKVENDDPDKESEGEDSKTEESGSESPGGGDELDLPRIEVDAADDMVTESTTVFRGRDLSVKRSRSARSPSVESRHSKASKHSASSIAPSAAPSPSPSPSRDSLQGASRTTGGILRSKGEIYNMADSGMLLNL